MTNEPTAPRDQAAADTGDDDHVEVGPDDEQPDDDERDEGSEAARYRRELRDTEDELTAARIMLGMARRAEVERLAGQHLAAPADLFDVGQLDLGDFLDDTGRIDHERVHGACQEILAARPGLARGPGAVANEPPAGTITWGEALQQLM